MNDFVLVRAGFSHRLLLSVMPPRSSIIRKGERGLSRLSVRPEQITRIGKILDANDFLS